MPVPSSNPFKSVFMIILSAYKRELRTLYTTPSQTYTRLLRVHRMHSVSDNQDYVRFRSFRITELLDHNLDNLGLKKIRNAIIVATSVPSFIQIR